MHEITANLNYLWSCLIIEELYRGGITNFCLSPGSRCTPLTVAVANHPEIHPIIHFDERGTGFFAIGNTRSTGRPSVLICTSGTAVANLFPAIVEAFQDHIPLLVITADRPPELRQTGANQTIDQVKIFQGFVRWQTEIPCPTLSIKPETILSVIDQAIYRSVRTPAGPVHLNCMFREPFLPEHFFSSNLESKDASKKTLISTRISKLYTTIQATAKAKTKDQFSKENRENNNAQKPSSKEIGKTTLCESFPTSGYLEHIYEWLKEKKTYQSYEKNYLEVGNESIRKISAAIRKARRGIIIIGRLYNEAEEQAVLNLSMKLGWPTFTDMGSGLRMGYATDTIIPYHSLLLESDSFVKFIKPDVLIQINGQFTSKTLVNLSLQVQPQAFFCISHTPERITPLHPKASIFEGRIDHTCNNISAKIQTTPTPNHLLKILKELISHIDSGIETLLRDEKNLSEPFIARSISQIIPQNSGLFLASSMPIRDMDLFADFKGKVIRLAVNRGGSGIDGTISTAVGFANGMKKTVTLLIGDLAFLHDLNSLSLVKQQQNPVVIVAINNNGGGIFSFLPISNYDEQVFSPYFATPHDLKLEKAASLFGLNYQRPKTKQEFKSVYKIASSQNQSSLIEIFTDRNENFSLHQKITKKMILEINNHLIS